jgi:sulfite reductase alpha subunit-like flavoprotein
LHLKCDILVSQRFAFTNSSLYRYNAARINEECPTLLDLLASHPSCKPGWGELLDALQPLQPRLYSITTAPEAHPGKPAVAFSVVKHTVPSGVERSGVATNWMDSEISAAVGLYKSHESS